MRFPFPPAEQVATMPVASAEPSLAELNVAVGEIAVATAIESEPESFSIDIAPEPPQLAAESVAALDPPELTAAPLAAQETPVAESRAIESDRSEASPLHSPESESVPPPVIQPRPRPKRKVIAFPRQPGTAESSHRLADPVLPEQPRILDVPEELEAYPSTPFLEGLQFEAAPSISAAPTGHVDHVELPFQPADIPQRVYAALMDLSLVALAAVIFAFIGHKMLPDLVLTKLVRVTAAMLLLLIWGIYQYLLLVYAGRTAGMQVAGVRLRTFKGRQPVLQQRRNRVLGLYLSAASLTMGLLWAFVDVDTLCWHDRISGTYLTRRE
jgi:uncharacterized RDD family membrane protein YckC